MSKKLTESQWRVLEYLRLNGPKSQKEIVSACDVWANTIRSLVGAWGYIEYVPERGYQLTEWYRRVIDRNS
jgi:hypothetical protein